jgi:hypothetical protein
MFTELDTVFKIAVCLAALSTFMCGFISGAWFTWFHMKIKKNTKKVK